MANINLEELVNHVKEVINKIEFGAEVDFNLCITQEGSEIFVKPEAGVNKNSFSNKI